MSFTQVFLKKNEDRRIRAGHPWIFSNEINTTLTPLKSFTAGQTVTVFAHDKTVLGVGYINPHSLIAIRLLSRNSEEKIDMHFFKQRIAEALHLRESLFANPYYRLVFSEGDELPGLVIDRFAQDFCIQLNTAGMDQKQKMIIEALQSLFPAINSIVLRNDSAIREYEGLSSYVKAIIGTPPDFITLIENDILFKAPLLTGQKTGWFYDHRLNRERLKHYVNGKLVLDVFSYLGGFGIHAAKFGAKKVDCVDASKQACELITENAVLNHVRDQVNVICEDAFSALKALIAERQMYDVIIIDPPAFVKKFKDKKEGLIAYQRINELATKLLKPNGILFSCSCSMHISLEDLTQMMSRIAYRTQTQMQIIERGHQGPDHPVHLSIPETDYLKALIVRKVK